jgi:histidinol phosphatase-like PHP family hydrolase
MLHNFHCHTTLSDGELSPMELIRRFAHAGYRTVAITDHMAAGGLERMIGEVAEEAEVGARGFGIDVIPGTELTHAPPQSIATLARRARAAGARIVVVHGETIVEPTAEGTNLAAVACPDVDILAHPGLITEEVARLAREHDVLLEITARKGHSLTNGHVAKLAKAEGAKVIYGLDAHGPGDILSEAMRDAVLRGAGMTDDQIRMAAIEAPMQLRERAGLIRE